MNTNLICKVFPHETKFSEANAQMILLFYF